MGSGDRELLLVNPVAGRGKALRVLPRVERALKRMGIPHETVRTSAPGDATYIAREAASAGRARVICLGGDGTVSETARGLLGTRTELALLPAGTGDDFARMLHLYRDLPLALRTLVDGEARPVDMGRFGPHTFINTVGLGYAGLVTHRNKSIKHLRGLPSYLAAVLQTLPGYKPPEFHLKARDWEFRGRGLLVEIGNGRSSGGGFFLTPGADIQDGLLDLTLLGDYAPLTRFAALPVVFAKKMHWLEGVKFFRSDIVQVSVDRPTLIHVDGNLDEMREPWAAEILPGALRVLFPRGAPGGNGRSA